MCIRDSIVAAGSKAIEVPSLAPVVVGVKLTVGYGLY